MLHSKLQGQWPFGSGDDFAGFSPYISMVAILTKIAGAILKYSRVIHRCSTLTFINNVFWGCFKIMVIYIPGAGAENPKGSDIYIISINLCHILHLPHFPFNYFLTIHIKILLNSFPNMNN